MMFQYDTFCCEHQSAEAESQWWAEQVETYLAPYRERLDAYLDRRVVGNLAATVAGQQRQHQRALLGQATQRWGRTVRHVFDRGYGTGPWLWQLPVSQVRLSFVGRKATSS